MTVQASSIHVPNSEAITYRQRVQQDYESSLDQRIQMFLAGKLTNIRAIMEDAGSCANTPTLANFLSESKTSWYVLFPETIESRNSYILRTDETWSKAIAYPGAVVEALRTPNKNIHYRFALDEARGRQYYDEQILSLPSSRFENFKNNLNSQEHNISGAALKEALAKTFQQ
jgi:hypothetical protein